MSSDGNQESVDKAKSILVSSITAIVILATGYILLKFLNPDLIKFQPIQPPSVVQERGYTFANVKTDLFENFFEGTGGVDKTKIGSSGIAGCNNCVDYTSATYGLTGNRSQNPGQNTFLNKTLVEKLAEAKKQFAGFVISEGYPPTGDHSSSCHNNGTCADVAVTNKTAANVDLFCAALKAQGISIFNEYTEFTSYTFTNCNQPSKTTYATGGHLHVR
jgi:hypothetical protein